MPILLHLARLSARPGKTKRYSVVSLCDDTLRPSSAGMTGMGIKGSFFKKVAFELATGDAKGSSRERQRDQRRCRGIM